jgi:hypothetical protein
MQKHNYDLMCGRARSAARTYDICAASMCVDVHLVVGIFQGLPRGRDLGSSDSDASLAQVANGFDISPSCLQRWSRSRAARRSTLTGRSDRGRVKRAA